MKKIIAAALFCCILSVTSVVLGVEQNQITEEAYYCTAKLFYCDPSDSKVVLTDVTPVGETTPSKTWTAANTEYTEVKLVGGGRFSDGITIPQEELNMYADSNVGVVVIRKANDEICVAALRFL